MLEGRPHDDRFPLVNQRRGREPGDRDRDAAVSPLCRKPMGPSQRRRALHADRGGGERRNSAADQIHDEVPFPGTARRSVVADHAGRCGRHGAARRRMVRAEVAHRLHRRACGFGVPARHVRQPDGARPRLADRGALGPTGVGLHLRHGADARRRGPGRFCCGARIHAAHVFRRRDVLSGLAAGADIAGGAARHCLGDGAHRRLDAQSLAQGHGADRRLVHGALGGARRKTHHQSLRARGLRLAARPCAYRHAASHAFEGGPPARRRGADHGHLRRPHSRRHDLLCGLSGPSRRARHQPLRRVHCGDAAGPGSGPQSQPVLAAAVERRGGGLARLRSDRTRPGS